MADSHERHLCPFCTRETPTTEGNCYHRSEWVKQDGETPSLELLPYDDMYTKKIADELVEGAESVLLPKHAWMGAIALFLLVAVSQVALSAERGFTILAVNDVYRIAGVDEGQRGGIARVRSLRAELEREHPDLLVLHAGDILFPSLISRLYDGRQMIDVLNLLDGDALGFDTRMFVTFGNHEFDKRKVKHVDHQPAVRRAADDRRA